MKQENFENKTAKDENEDKLDEVEEKTAMLMRTRKKLKDTKPNKNERKEARRDIDKQLDQVGFVSFSLFFYIFNISLQLAAKRKELLEAMRKLRAQSQGIMDKQVQDISLMTEQVKEKVSFFLF